MVEVGGWGAGRVGWGGLGGGGCGEGGGGVCGVVVVWGIRGRVGVQCRVCDRGERGKK